MQKRELPEGWDKDFPTYKPDAKGLAGRTASGKVLNALAKNMPWLIGGSADLAPSTLTRLTFEGAGDFGTRRERPQPALRHPRARDGRRDERHRAVEGPQLRLGLLRVRRLLPAADPPRGDHGDPGHPHLHARLDRRRRGWSDAPADRAPRVAARDPGPHRAAPRRRERGRRSVARDRRHQASPGRPRAVAPGDADARSYEVRGRLGLEEGRVRARRCRGRQARRHPDGDRHRGLARARRARQAHRRRRQVARRQHAVVGVVRGAGRGVSRLRAAARRQRAHRGRAGIVVRLGALHRSSRQDDRDADVRRLGSAQGAADEVRLPPGSDRRRRPRPS